MTGLQKDEDACRDPFEFTHDWAERAVMNFENLVRCLTWGGRNQDRLKSLRGFVGDATDSFVTLKTQEDGFDFDYFSHGIDEPAEVFEFDESPSSYHDVVRDLVDTWGDAMYHRKALSEITRQAADALGVRDIARIAAVLSDVTGHDDLKEIKKRLHRLAGGLGKEYARLRAKPPTAKRDGRSGSDPGGIEADTHDASHGRWWHEQGEKPPSAYPHGPLIGKQKDICRWMGEKPTRNPRRLKQKAKSGAVWVKKMARTSWAVWFQNEKAWKSARSTCESGTGNAPSAPATL